MDFPFYFLTLVALLIFATVAIVVYFQVYKRHINKVLESSEGNRTSMIPPNRVVIIMTVIGLLIGLFISYSAGYVNAYKDYKKDTWVMSASDIQTFYAEVKEVDEHSILVEGISLNEENYRGELQYEVWPDEAVIQLSAVSEGDLVSITLLTDRTGHTEVFKIQLLAGEK